MCWGGGTDSRRSPGEQFNRSYRSQGYYTGAACVRTCVCVCVCVCVCYVSVRACVDVGVRVFRGFFLLNICEQSNVHFHKQNNKFRKLESHGHPVQLYHFVSLQFAGNTCDQALSQWCSALCQQTLFSSPLSLSCSQSARLWAMRQFDFFFFFFYF